MSVHAHEPGGCVRSAPSAIYTAQRRRVVGNVTGVETVAPHASARLVGRRHGTRPGRRAGGRGTHYSRNLVQQRISTAVVGVVARIRRNFDTGMIGLSYVHSLTYFMNGAASADTDDMDTSSKMRVAVMLPSADAVYPVFALPS